MNIAWEGYLSASNSLRPDIATIRERATAVIRRPFNKDEDGPHVTFVDVHTELADGTEGPVYRMFANGVVDKGTEEPTPETDVDPAAREAAVTMILDLAKALTGAQSANLGKKFAWRDKPDGAASEFVHNYLADHAKAVADILRNIPDLL